MRRSVAGGLVLGLAALVLGHVPGATATPTAAPAPAGEVRVQGQAYEGQFNTFTGTLRLTCRPGLVVTALGLTFTQDFTSPEGLEGTIPTCDGRWHTQTFRSLEGFHAGRASVDVRMSVADAATGVPRGDVTASGSVFVRPGARVLLPRTARLRPGGVVEATVLGRCDEPWVLQDFFVAVSQHEGFSFASTLLDIPCDGVYHARTVRLPVAVGAPFNRGWAYLDATISTLDGENFDPAIFATSGRPVRVT